MKQTRDTFFFPLLRGVWMVLLLTGTLSLFAQQFTVQRFRVLPNDISAYIQPVKDLNDEACALLKVVGSRDFAFSTPLGVVKRANEVGEIWLYVPHGTVQLTIKHPQWGVLRDYRLPEPLESRMTYELVLQSQLVEMPERDILPIDRVTLGNVYQEMKQPENMPYRPWVRPRRPKEAVSWMIIPELTVYKDGMAGGGRVVWMRRHGIYVSGASHFTACPATQPVTCDKYGNLTDGGIPPFLSGNEKKSYYQVLAGGVHRIAGLWYIYEGIGYGQRKVVWETEQRTYLLNDDYSKKGVAAEVGVLFRLKRWVFSGGVTTLTGSIWSGHVGVGFRL